MKFLLNAVKCNVFLVVTSAYCQSGVELNFNLFLSVVHICQVYLHLQLILLKLTKINFLGQTSTWLYLLEVL